MEKLQNQSYSNNNNVIHQENNQLELHWNEEEDIDDGDNKGLFNRSSKL